MFFVSDLSRSLHFYLHELGFVKEWHEADGTRTVCQVDRGECEIILSRDATRRTRSRRFIELTPAGLEGLRRELSSSAVPHAMSRWGYDVVQVVDGEA